MMLKRNLGLSAAAVAGLFFTQDGFAAGLAFPNDQLDFSAQTIALTPGGNQVTFDAGNLAYSVLGATGIPAGSGVTVTFRAPTGDAFTNPGGSACLWSPGDVTTALAVSANTMICTVPGVGGPFTSVQLTNPTPTGAITLAGPDVANLASNIYPGLASLNGSAPSATVPITAQATSGGAFTGDMGPLTDLTLDSHTSFNLAAVPTTQGIDLTGGNPAIAPGAGFATNLPNGTKGVSTAGFLGTLWVNVGQGDLDARTGLAGINGPTNTGIVNSAAAVTGTVTVTLIGDFATLTGAYLVPNNNGQPTASQATCAATAPANALGGTIDAAKRSINFNTFGTPANDGGASPQPVYSVCLVTNGTQVIHATGSIPGLGPTAADSVRLMVSVAVAGLPAAISPIVLTAAPSQAFGTIDYQGSVFFAQNVFGVNNFYPTFFRAVNRTNQAAQIWAVLTKDVNNVSPETGNGSCTDPGTTPPSGPGGTPCNISFVANLTATSDPTGSSKGLLQANTGAYYTADAIASLAGTTLPGGNNKSTMYLLSPNMGVSFSALSQNPATLDLIVVP